MRRMCFVCERCDAKKSIARSHQVYFYLQRILMLLEMEVYRVNEIVKRKQLCFSCGTTNMERFLSEGQIYLSMANVLHERNQKMSKMFTIMLKAMDIYSKLKTDLRDKENEDDWQSDMDFDSEDDDYDNGFHINVIPFDYDEIIDSGEESDDLFGEDIDTICFYCAGEVYYREFLLVNIESLFTRIKSQCVSFTESSSTLYIMLYLELRDYCERAKLFLYGNMRNAKSTEERGSSRDYCHKYDLLEKLLARVSKEQEYVMRYVDIKFEEEE